MRLSLLICTVPSRREKVASLLQELDRQIEENNALDQVEILCLYDNKKHSVGAKRNWLVKMSRGTHLAFIDDDDRVHPEYLREILRTIKNNRSVDVITFNIQYTVAGDENIPYVCAYNLFYPIKHDHKNRIITAMPSHIHVFHRHIHEALSFPDTSRGEDYHWMVAAQQVAKTQVNINKVLYYYDFDIKTTETQRAD